MLITALAGWILICLILARQPPEGRGLLSHEVSRTQWCTTAVRIPLDEWSARRRDLYLTTHRYQNRQTSMPPVGFEPTISAGARTQTYALDCAITGTGNTDRVHVQIFVCLWLNSFWRARASSLSWFHDRTHTQHTRQDSSRGVIGPTQRPLPDKAQHSQLTHTHSPCVIRTRNPSKRADANQRLRPRSHWTDSICIQGV